MDVTATPEHPLLARRRAILAEIEKLEAEALTCLELYEQETGQRPTVPVFKTTAGMPEDLRRRQVETIEQDIRGRSIIELVSAEELRRWAEAGVLAQFTDERKTTIRLTPAGYEQANGRALTVAARTVRGFQAPALECSCPRYPGGGRQSTDPLCPLHSGDARD